MMRPLKRIHLVSLALLAMFAAPAWGQVVNEDLKITASDGALGDEFGGAIDIDQGIIAVGARNDDDNGVDSGAAYLFSVTTGAQTAKLVPADGAAGDEFGFSVAVKGGVVVVGAVRDVHNGIASGSAYLFDASTGAQLAKLTASDAAAGDEFGFAVATDGVVGIGHTSCILA